MEEEQTEEETREEQTEEEKSEEEKTAEETGEEELRNVAFLGMARQRWRKRGVSAVSRLTN
jgi:hypothetical protein